MYMVDGVRFSCKVQGGAVSVMYAVWKQDVLGMYAVWKQNVFFKDSYKYGAVLFS